MNYFQETGALYLGFTTTTTATFRFRRFGVIDLTGLKYGVVGDVAERGGKAAPFQSRPSVEADAAAN